jgi:PAS domain S-box-containing protein
VKHFLHEHTESPILSSSSSKPALANGYVVAVLATSAILLFLRLLGPLDGGRPPLLLFSIAVMLATWYGATRAGLFATALSALGSIVFLQFPADSPIVPVSERLPLFLLVGTGLLTTFLTGKLRKTELVALERSVERQRQLETTLREREELGRWFEWAVEAAPNGMILVGEDGTILMANAQAERLFGYAQDELVGETIEILVPERFLTQHKQDRRQFLAHPQTRSMGKGRDLYGRRKDGREVPVEIGLSPIDTPEGILVLASVVDISERKRLEASVREREARYSLLAETVPEILYTADPEGHYDYLNQRYYAFTGQSPENAFGDGWIEAVHPEDRVRVQTRWRESVSQGEPFDTEFRLRCHDGSYKWFCSHSLPVRDEQGRILKWFGVTADVNEQKRAQEVLRELDRRKDEFLAMLAHELRNPLAPIRNAVQVMRRLDPLETKLQWVREVIDRQVKHMTCLVNDLLDVSRITQGKVRLHLQAVELAEVAADTIEAVRPLMEARKHRLTVKLPPGPVRLTADPTRLVQILENLLSNAAKYTPNGGHIELTLEPADTQVRLRVEDDGVGMAPEMLAWIFEPFAQAEQSLDRSAGGLGIGLTLVRRLVELHGGTVRAFSAGPGRGSEFVVSLPIALSAEEGLTPGPTNVQPASAPPGPSRSPSPANA